MSGLLAIASMILYALIAVGFTALTILGVYYIITGIFSKDET